MTNRRTFLQTTALVAAAPMAARAGFASAGAARGAPGDRHAAVIDVRYAVSVSFGEQASIEGVATRPIEGDITALWFHELDALWSQRPTAIAGLTARPALFCLEQLAWAHGMRVVFHAEHAQQTTGAVRHKILIPAPGLSDAELRAAGSRWPAYAAAALAHLPLGNMAARGPSQACMPSTLGDDETTMHSWMIAPVVRSTTRGATS